MVNTALSRGRETNKWRLDEMSWPEVRAAIEAGRTTVIAAAGSMEQHGPHLPLQTDTLLGTFLVEGIVERVPGAFQGPTIPFGVSTHHMAFAGTITLDEDAFKTVVRQYAESLAQHGFENIVIIPSHGGNFGPLKALEEEMGGRAGNARFLTFSDLMQFMVYFSRVAESDGIDLSVAGAHAGEAETSLVLAANERLAQMEHAIEGYVGDFGAEAASKIFNEGMPALTDNGILGDARPADRDRGFRYRDTMADALAEWIRERIPS
jgi:creatinine amidohydrolase